MHFMVREKFTIVKEKRPDRCDICHKSDLFDPGTGICQRCKNLPVQELTNPEINTVRIVPPSTIASTLAAAISCLCLSATMAILNGLFATPTSILVVKREFFQGLVVLTLLNFLISIALNRWCSDRYSERLDQRVVVMGIFCSSLGLISTLLGLTLLLLRLFRS
jgi:hypothetical protein